MYQIGKEWPHQRWHKNLCFSISIYILQSVDIISYILHNLMVSSFQGVLNRSEFIGQMFTQKQMVVPFTVGFERGCTGSFRQLESWPPEG